MELISREEAKRVGQLFYYTGKACSKNHTEKRYVSTHQCFACVLEHKKKAQEAGKNKLYYTSNKEKVLEASKKYRSNNKVKISERKKKYAELNKEKIKEYKKQYHVLNREKICKKVKDYIEANKEEVKSRAKIYREKTKDKKAEYDKIFSKENKDYRNMLKAQNRAKRLKRIVEWDEELTEFVSQEAFDLCHRREKVTGVKWHVDHIIPLCGKNVSGLHVWNNLAVIPAAQNLSKNNSYSFE